jgi:hypothetical protein
MSIRHLLHFARRNKFLIAATALLMAGAGCVGAARKAGEQLTQDALKPLTLPVESYKSAVDSASAFEANQKAQAAAAGGLEGL